MASFNDFIRNFINHKLQEVDKSYPDYMIDECIDIIMKNQKKGEQIRLELEDFITIMDNNSRQVYGVVKPNQSSKMVYSTKAVNFQLFDKLSDFQKTYKKTYEHFIYHHNHLQIYMVGRIEEHINELTYNGALYGKFILRDCNIRTTKCNGEKFYRVTYVAPEGHDLGLSITELAFGHHIDGITYIFPEIIFKKHKDQILQCVDYEETEFGKNTRWDIGGNPYKKQKNKKNKKK